MSGTLEDLSPAQAEALGKFKASLPADITVEDDHEALRFLRARKFDVDLAKTMFLERHHWYIHNRISQLVDCDPPKIEYFRRMIPFSFHGFDKQGRPFYVEKSGRIHPDFLLNFFTDEEMLTAHLWSMEISVKRFAEGIQRTGKHVEKFATVMDLEGISLNSRHALPIVKMFAGCDSKYYPERMGWLAVINAPSVFSTLWPLVKSFLDPVTVSKIHVLGADYKEKLRELVDEDQLPVEYGGKCSLNCAHRNTRASHQCCVPYYSDHELTEMLKVDDSKFSTEQKIKNGKSFEHDVPVQAGNEYTWYFRTHKHDIEFEARFTPSEPAGAPSEVISARKRIEHHQTGFHSGLRALTNGTVKLIWDNSGSMFTSKTIDYSVESKPFVPQSNFGAEVLEPIRALQRARTASQEQQQAASGASDAAPVASESSSASAVAGGAAE